jgi:FAD/FMN-containing dehydrogenase
MARVPLLVSEVRASSFFRLGSEEGHFIVTGHATTGGMGELSRKWGFALDAIKEAEVVVATGEVLNVSEKENADLFWVGQFVTCSISFSCGAKYTNSA